jgi:glutamate formiminotransferase/formiminotetrahydrofolate cyclodeaminase
LPFALHYLCVRSGVRGPARAPFFSENHLTIYLMRRLIECVPNFSEGRDMGIIKQITEAIESVEGVRLLDVDPGKATNRTVVTFVGEPEPVAEAAYLAIAKAAELIDMRGQRGEHPRMGATDVCPFVPISGVTMEEAVAVSRQVAQRVGETLGIPVFLYEHSATDPRWKSLSNIRAGEYEKMAEKLAGPDFVPDFGPRRLSEKSGVTAIGARDFLIAYNVNLNTTSVRRANSVAFDVRENGRVKTDAAGQPVKGPDGTPEREPGTCPTVAGIGWYIEEYGIAQVSMNLKNTRVTPVHVAFEECCRSAERRGMRVTGSELVGLTPLGVLLDAGRYFLKKQHRSAGVSEAELVKIAVKSLGLDDLAPFDPRKKVIEYLLEDAAQRPLVSMDLGRFADETASESPAPGGGSISAYLGALGAALATMVANLSSHKKGWDDRWEEFSDWAEHGQRLKDRLLALVDEDTRAFNGIMAAFQMPKDTPEAKAARKSAVQAATRRAIEVPLEVMRLSAESFGVIRAMAEHGNPNSVSDAGVGALCARAAVLGAWLNVKINANGFDDRDFLEAVLAEGQRLADEAVRQESEILALTKLL